MPNRKWTLAQLIELTDAGVSFNEIRKTCGADYRTVKRHFPDYAPFRPGGWREEGGAIRELNRQLKDLETAGKIHTKYELQARQRKLDEVRQADNADYIERRF